MRFMVFVNTEFYPYVWGADQSSDGGGAPVEAPDAAGAAAVVRSSGENGQLFVAPWDAVECVEAAA